MHVCTHEQLTTERIVFAISIMGGGVNYKFTRERKGGTALRRVKCALLPGRACEKANPTLEERYHPSRSPIASDTHRCGQWRSGDTESAPSWLPRRACSRRACNKASHPERRRPPEEKKKWIKKIQFSKKKE